MSAPVGFLELAGGLFEVPGLAGAGVRTGVKASGDLDLALIVADAPMTAAGVFTRNRMAAAPVHLCRAKLATAAKAKAIVINSGNANALTGPDGEDHARAMMEATEAAVGGPALVLSTGVIGVPLPVERVLGGIRAAAGRLGRGAAQEVARAMLTTDTCEKQAALRGERFTVGGVAKGSGMIHPNMATTLAVIATDAPIEAAAAAEILREAIDRSFHQISVDGDTSTNDAVLLLGGAVEDADAARRAAELLPEVTEAVTWVARSLAGQVVEDGEGKTRLMDLRVLGAASEEDARRVASAVATSSLVKTALAGGDPNWGRILSAAGNAGVDVTPAAVSLRLAGHLVFERGRPIAADETTLARAFGQERVEVELTVGAGAHEGRMLTTDLSHRYVEINADYRT